MRIICPSIVQTSGLAGHRHRCHKVNADSHRISLPRDRSGAYSNAQERRHDRDFGKGNANSLNSELDAALASLARGNPEAAANQLSAMRSEINSLVADGVVAASDVAALLDLLNHLIDSLS
jgi:hypothetical protein